MVQQPALSFPSVTRHSSFGEGLDVYRVPVQLQPARRIDVLAHIAGRSTSLRGNRSGTRCAWHTSLARLRGR